MKECIISLKVISADPCRQHGERVRGGLTKNNALLEALRQLVFLELQKVTLGSGGRCPQAPPRPTFKARLFECGAVLEPRQLEDCYSFLIGAVLEPRRLEGCYSLRLASESDVRHCRGPLPPGPVRPSGAWCLSVAQAPFWSLGGWKIALGAVLEPRWLEDCYNVFVGPVHPSGLRCLSVVQAPFWSLGGWKTAIILLKASEGAVLEPRWLEDCYSVFVGLVRPSH
eukprot:s1650_g7.t1